MHGDFNTIARWDDHFNIVGLVYGQENNKKLFLVKWKIYTLGIVIVVFEIMYLCYLFYWIMLNI